MSEPRDPEVRDMAALAYVVKAAEALGFQGDEEADLFIYARAVFERVTGPSCTV